MEYSNSLKISVTKGCLVSMILSSVGKLYVAYKDYNWMMDLVEAMVEKVAIDLHGTTQVQVGEHEINFQRHGNTLCSRRLNILRGLIFQKWMKKSYVQRQSN